MNPAQVSLSQVVEAINDQGTRCERVISPAARNLAEALTEIHAAYYGLLGTVTIAQLTQRADPQDWVI